MKTPKQYYEQLNKRWNGRLSAKGFTRTHAPVIAHCNKCGHTWKQHYAYELTMTHHKYPCPFCRAHMLPSQSRWQKQLAKVNKKNGTHYKSISKYIGYHKHIKMIDLDNGHIWTPLANNVLKGHGYRKYARYTKHSLQKKLNEIYGHNIIIVKGPYKNRETKVKAICNRHHVIWNVKPGNLLNGHGCPMNKTSRGERIMKFILDHNHIAYKYGYHLHTNRHYHRRLHLDFYLPEMVPKVGHHVYSNGLGIEIDGVQHREPVKYFGGKDHFYVTKIHDYEKNLYCLRHHIYLLRVPYIDHDSSNRIAKRCMKGLKKPSLLRQPQ